MSVFQAVAAFEHFTGVTADAEAMLADSAELVARRMLAGTSRTWYP